MSDDDTLVCMGCDEIVRVKFGFEGYTGACGCERYAFSVGGGDHPRTWERLEDATSTGNFKFYRDGMVDGDEVVEDSYIVCTVCNEQDAIETSLEAEGLDLFGNDLKVAIRCENDHYSNNRPVEETVYLSSSLWRADVAKDVYLEGADAE